MTRSQHAWRLAGETVREIGILGLVFAPLESTFGDRPLDPEPLVLVVLASVLMIGCGILAEMRGRCA